MKRNNGSSLVVLMLFLLIVFNTFSILGVEARKRNKTHKHHKHKYPANIFNIFKFGAKGNGISDDSKALAAAWKTACKVESAVVRIPSGFKFLIKPLSLQGPCMPHLVLQIDGALLAPAKIGAWQKYSLYQWINIKWIQNFTIQGTGTIDGQGSNWWKLSQIEYMQKSSKKVPDMKPTALRFYASYNITICDIRIINSPQCHLKFDNSGQIKVTNITISSPEDSPNTDGIHLQNTQDVEIQHSNIKCGDDCVSIQTGCSNVYVHHVNCGPGHGISLGGLGKDRSVACVSDIVVDNISMQNTLYGARIKTWQGGIGEAKNVTFSNIQISNVKIPLVIDQYYCDKNFCQNQTDAVSISGVKYDRIIGTYSVQPIHLACSNDIPCTGINLINIQLKPTVGYQGLIRQASCWNTYGRTKAPLVPSSIDYCLKKDDDDGGTDKQITTRSSYENVC